MTYPKLKPCPFCGCEMLIAPDIGDYPERLMITDYHRTYCIFKNEEILSYQVNCEGVVCFASNWNSRY